MILVCCQLQINKFQRETASARCMVIMHVPAWFYFRVSICNPEEALISGVKAGPSLPLQLSYAFNTECPAACLPVPSEPSLVCSLQALSGLSFWRLTWGIVYDWQVAFTLCGDSNELQLLGEILPQIL